MNNRETSELMEYINRNHLFEEVFMEMQDVLTDIRAKISLLPNESAGKQFLVKFIEEKEKVILDLSKTDIMGFDDTNQINAI